MNAFQIASALPWINRQFTVGIDLALTRHNVVQTDAVLIRRELQIVANVDGIDQEPELFGELFAHALNTAQQIAALRFVDQRYQAVAHLKADLVNLVHIFPAKIQRIGLSRVKLLDFLDHRLLFGLALKVGQHAQ